MESRRSSGPRSRRFDSAATPLRGLFVTGTDTSVGKTVLAAALAAALADRGERVAVFKPAVTGLDASGPLLPDHQLLLASARSEQLRNEVSPYLFGPPLSPHLAADLAGVRIDPVELVNGAQRAARGADVIVVEGVGGLMVPLRLDYLVRDFAVDLGLPLLVAARPGLGTINHSVLTVEAARSAGLEVAAVVLTPWPEEPGEIELSNMSSIAALTGVEVVGLKPLYTGPPINAVADLPIDGWLSACRATPPATPAAV